jgi:hypothetical protein
MINLHLFNVMLEHLLLPHVQKRYDDVLVQLEHV